MSDQRQQLTGLCRGAWALVVAFLAFVGFGELFANQVDAGPPHNVFVCKYVGTPGVDERLQTGDNPILVSLSSIPPGVFFRTFFADQQGRSFILGGDPAESGQPQPDVSDCPPPEGPPTTTMETTTTTAAGPTTTATGPTTTSGDDYPPQATPPTTVPGPGPVPGPGAGPGGLPATGSNSDSTLPIAAAALLAGTGLLLTAGMRRRPTKR